MLALATGCGLFAPEGPRVFVQASDGIIGERTHFVVHNNGNGIVYLSRCGEHFGSLEQLQGRDWATIQSPFCFDNLMQGGIALAPGDERADSLTIADVGTYRIRVQYYTDATSPEPVPAVSARFKQGYRYFALDRR